MKALDEAPKGLVLRPPADGCPRGTAVEETGPDASRNALQSVTLLETIESEGLDAALGAEPLGLEQQLRAAGKMV